MSKPKPAVLCVDYGAIITHSNAHPEQPGVYDLDLADVPHNMYHFLNRRVCDTTATMGLFHDIARELPQLLVYATIQNEAGEYLSYSRGTDGGETRLAGHRSIGIGGHTDIADVVLDREGNINAKATLINSATRELLEEVNLDITGLIAIPDQCKILTNFEDPASAVHVGVWVKIVTKQNEIQESAETREQKWCNPTLLFNDLENYEPWSQLIIKTIQ